MAYIKKRGKCWRWRVVLGYDAQGKRIVKNGSYYPKAKSENAQYKEVSAYVQEIERKIKNNEYFNNNDLTLNDFFISWRDNYALNHLTPAQKENYCRILERVFLSQLGYLKIDNITPLHIQEIITKLEKKDNLKPQTIKKYITCLSSIMNKAYSLGIIKENPCKRLELPKITKDTKIHTFTETQARAFLSALEREYKIDHKEHTRMLKASRNVYKVPSYVQIIKISSMWQAFFYLSLFSGLRRGEMISLTWHDIDFKKKTIKVYKNTVQANGKQIIKEPKTKASIRTFLLPDIVLEKLKAWKQEETKQCKQLSNIWEGEPLKNFNDNYIFIQNTGKQMYLTTPTSKFREILLLYNSSVNNKEKLPIIKLHDLRHCTASLLIANGIDIATVSALLGHSKTSITLDIYTHSLKRLNDSSLKLEKILLKEKNSLQ